MSNNTIHSEEFGVNVRLFMVYQDHPATASLALDPGLDLRVKTMKDPALSDVLVIFSHSRPEDVLRFHLLFRSTELFESADHLRGFGRGPASILDLRIAVRGRLNVRQAAILRSFASLSCRPAEGQKRNKRECLSYSSPFRLSHTTLRLFGLTLFHP